MTPINRTDSGSRIPTPPPAPDGSETAKKSAAKAKAEKPSFIERALGIVGLGGAAKAAKEGAENVRKAGRSQPTPERAVISSAFELFKQGHIAQARVLASVANVGKEAVEGALEIAINNPVAEAGKIAVTEAAKGVAHIGRSLFGFGVDAAARGANGATKAAGSLKDSATAIAERTIDQHRENAREIGDAASKYGRDWVDSLNPIDDEVRSAWNDAPTIERKVAFAAYETAENLVQDSVRNTVNAANVGKEIVEAGVENVVTTGKNVVDAVTAGPKAAVGFVKGLFG
jgi:hypothetical protein